MQPSNSARNCSQSRRFPANWSWPWQGTSSAVCLCCQTHYQILETGRCVDGWMSPGPKERMQCCAQTFVQVRSESGLWQGLSLEKEGIGMSAGGNKHHRKIIKGNREDARQKMKKDPWFVALFGVHGVSSLTVGLNVELREAHRCLWGTPVTGWKCQHCTNMCSMCIRVAYVIKKKINCLSFPPYIDIVNGVTDTD